MIGGDVEGGAQARRAPHHSLYIQILLAILAGVVLGVLAPDVAVQCKVLGDMFVRLIRMVISPVIFLTVCTGIAGMRAPGALGRVMAKAMAYFLALSTLALVIGLAVALFVQPGRGMNVDIGALDGQSVADYVVKAHAQSAQGFLLEIIPDSLVSPLAGTNVLQALVAAVLIGLGVSFIGARAEPLRALLDQAALVVFRVVELVMRLAPVGTFGAMAFTIGKFGAGTIARLAGLVGCFYLTSALFVTVVLGSVALLNGFSLWRLLRYRRDELLLVLGTSSSEAALPSLMGKLEEAGCDKSVVGLVVPAGYSFNLDGTNIYLTLAALFLAQACNVHLGLGQMALLLGVAVLSSKGAAGVTGAGFITLAATLAIVPSVPVAAMALILGVDRFMSQCRSLTNFIGNAVATIVIARWEGGLERAALDRALGGASILTDAGQFGIAE
ncbi:MAG TPA: C4-dicarboxylate transporter DctA [Novosphingobium sp.]|nr:C4-dicarboxylate transporter DctA [Novosphingobium sp.]